MAEISLNNLQTQVNSKAASSHTHTKANISDFAHTHVKSQITDFPTSLPASGGNADTLDGKHFSDIQALVSGGFDAGHLFAANGYQKFSNGLIFQWGEITVAGNSTAYVNLPTSYTAAHLQVVASNSTDIGYDYSQTGGAVAPNGLSQIAMMNIENSPRLLRWFSIGY